MVQKATHILIGIALAVFAITSLRAQTFELNNQNGNGPKGTKKNKSSNTAPPQQQNSQNGLGWGSSIETARNSRAAQQALEKGNYRDAAGYASRAAHGAPQNASLWFLWGYSARLAGLYPDSEYAYKKGLQLRPSSIQGLSGLAQTYAKMGRGNEAQAILKKVLAANPKSVDDLELAGELALSSDPQTALDLLKRADAQQATARSELLIARAYQRLNQPEASKQYLDRAQSRAPNDPGVLRAVAAFERDAGQYDPSIAILKKVVPRAPDALPELAYTYQLAGKRKEAAEAYSRAADRATHDVGLQLSAAQAVVNVGQFDHGETFLKRAAAIEPDNYRLHAIWGQIASIEDRNDDAIREYRFAVDHLPPAVQEGPLYPVSLHLSLYEMYQRTNQPTLGDTELIAARNGLNGISGQESSPEFLRLRALIEADSNDPVSAEKDLKAALAIDPNNVNIMLNYGNLLWRTDRKQDAFKLYASALNLDPTSHSALTALGYLSREISDPTTAEKYFLKLEQLYPNDFVPYLALGDLYTSERQFAKSQENYEKSHALAPNNALIVVGGTNSALESQDLPLARKWLDRAEGSPSMDEVPQVMRERERYLTRTGKYEESANLGYKVLQKLPNDPEVPVYLAYDLLYLNRYDEAYNMAVKYERILPKDKDLQLIKGYVHAHEGYPREAEADFTRALELAPNVATTYMNRGYVRNDLREAEGAIKDFEAAIRLRPDYGEAHLGLAYSYLQLRRGKLAIKEADIAAKTLGESSSTHLARAEGYRQQMLFRPAVVEYRAALQFAPKDVTIHLEVADALYRLHLYNDAIDALKGTLGLGGDEALIYAEMARNYAQLRERDNALKAIAQSEQHGSDSKVLMENGEALMALGEHKAAMERYSRALDAPHSDRVEVRLALARLFAVSGRHDQAQQQVGFALAEARVGEANAVTPENLIEAADVLMAINQFDLARKYFERAQSLGADDESVSLGLANAYLAEGRTQSAAQVLKALGNSSDNNDNYEYLIAMGNVYRQEQDSARALTMFARANQVSQGNEYSRQTEIDLAGDTGKELTPNIAVQPDFTVGPIFEDINIYQLDARLLGVPNASLLPPPRSSTETIGAAHYKVHFNGWPVISGMVAERNARGTFAFPSELFVLNENSYDTIFNGGVNPVVHLGNNTITFNPGLQFTIRRDTRSPVDLNQDLFRQYLYVNTSSFGNWVSFSGSMIREAGPFTEQNLHSRDAAGTVEFKVGRPWAKTALITGYQGRDVLFRPLIREYYTTATYLGVQQKFGSSWQAAVFAEYLRSWRVQDSLYAIAQAMTPGFRLDYAPFTSHWAVHVNGEWSQGEGFHAYDNVSNQVTVSYMRTVQRSVRDGAADVPVNYPMRFSFGLAQQTFYDFQGKNRNSFVPIVRINLF
ncbi:MAG: tetratricopeptide repeat protein [Terriglobales bacterium]